jgi:hypothetical protein
MERSFIVKTVATVIYENWVEITDEEIDEYRANNPEYAESTDEEIVQVMYADSEVSADECNPIDWQDEQVIGTYEYKY